MNRVQNRILTETEIQIVQSFRALNPRTALDLRKMGYTALQDLGSGLYRTAYRIQDTDLVIKVPRGSEIDVEHSVAEIKAWSKLLRSPLAHVVPPLRYHNDAGIIVTDYLTLQVNSDRETREALAEWRINLKFPKGIYGVDMHHFNIGVYNQRFVLSDMGCFECEVPRED